MFRPGRAVAVAALAGLLAAMTPGQAAAQDRPAIIVDLTVLEALEQTDGSNRPSWKPPIPERRPIPPILRRRPVFAEPETVPVPVETPSSSRVVSARLEPAAPQAVSEPASPATPLAVSMTTAPAHGRRPIPVTANALFIRQITPLATVPPPLDPEESTGPNVDGATARDIIGDIVTPLPGGQGFRMVFVSDHTKLSETGERLLDTVAERLEAEDDLRLSVQAYAGGSPETASRSRLLSLERALAVRNYLSERGVRGSRIDLRALGNTFADGPPERVDLLLVAE